MGSRQTGLLARTKASCRTVLDTSVFPCVWGNAIRLQTFSGADVHVSLDYIYHHGYQTDVLKTEVALKGTPDEIHTALDMMMFHLSLVTLSKKKDALVSYHTCLGGSELRCILVGPSGLNSRWLRQQSGADVLAQLSYGTGMAHVLTHGTACQQSSDTRCGW